MGEGEPGQGQGLAREVAWTDNGWWGAPFTGPHVVQEREHALHEQLRGGGVVGR